MGRPYPVSDDILLATVAGDDMPATITDLRRELDYLEDRELLQISGKDTAHWNADLTRTGVDLVEYTIDCDPGIARPQKYW
ncbi:MAG: hypothetical protein KAV87_09445 [Desulfobacteraceae bacterium]|nr:hypothetical protein [Desulfobacteraceae bacterium]